MPLWARWFILWRQKRVARALKSTLQQKDEAKPWWPQHQRTSTRSGGNTFWRSIFWAPAWHKYQVIVHYECLAHAPLTPDPTIGTKYWGYSYQSRNGLRAILWWEADLIFSFLADPIPFDDPPASYLSSTPGSTIAIVPDTRKGYLSAIDSYESFSMLMQSVG